MVAERISLHQSFSYSPYFINQIQDWKKRYLLLPVLIDGLYRFNLFEYDL